MANFFDFTSDTLDIYFFLLDESGSMSHDREKVREGLRLFKKSFEGFSEANSIAISVSTFRDYSIYTGDFKQVNALDIGYYPNGGTPLYYAITEGAKHLDKYVTEVIERKGVKPKVTFILFSDGEPNDSDKRYRDSARNIIEGYNYAGWTTAFVAFGSAIDSNFGRKLGFASTIDVVNKSSLENFLGVELSKRCKEQSKRSKGFGANFFSKAADNGNSAMLSHTTAQALENPDWYDDI